MKNKYSSGKLNEDDEGATLIRMGVQDNVIIIDFGITLKWIGLHKEQAEEFVGNLIQLLKQLEVPTQ